MPTDQQIALVPGPRSVKDARRWVVRRCRDLGRPELAECAEVGVSELVSNALLHGSHPIQVGIAGTTAHPRVEVRDASTDAPSLRLDAGFAVGLGLEEALVAGLGHGPADPFGVPVSDEDDALLTFGRGLGIVARCSRAWGADIDDAGKVVWFEPAEQVDDQATEGVVTGLDRDVPRPRRRARTRIFVLRDVPLRLHVSFVRHYRELRREIRLLALAHGATYPLARDLSELFTALEAPSHDGLLLAAPTAETAPPQEDGTDLDVEVDLAVPLTRAGAAGLRRLGELLEQADAFCREERLLSLARDREQRRFQRWLLEELAAQDAGASPSSWAEQARTG